MSLVADRREVADQSLTNYISEFEEEFVEKATGPQARPRNYILKSYVFGPFLNDNALPE